MKTLVYLSRAFVEFGPFTTKEMTDFHARGILRDIDHIRWHGENDWVPLKSWIASVTVIEKPEPKPKTKVPKKEKAATAKPKVKAAKKPKKGGATDG